MARKNSSYRRALGSAKSLPTSYMWYRPHVSSNAYFQDFRAMYGHNREKSGLAVTVGLTIFRLALQAPTCDHRISSHVDLPLDVEYHKAL